MLKICLFGLAGSGKTTAADYLCARHGAAVVSQSGRIKLLAQALFSFPDRSLYGPSQRRNEPYEVVANYRGLTYTHFSGFRDPAGAQLSLMEFVRKHWGVGWNRLTPRTVLQLIGTEWGRAYEPGIWTRLAAQTLEKSSAPFGVISDGRFMDEAQDVNVLIDRAGAGLSGDHASETSLPPQEWYDVIIPNNGSLQDLYTAIDLGLMAKL